LAPAGHLFGCVHGHTGCGGPGRSPEAVPDGRVRIRKGLVALLGRQFGFLGCGWSPPPPSGPGGRRPAAAPRRKSRSVRILARYGSPCRTDAASGPYGEVGGPPVSPSLASLMSPSEGTEGRRGKGTVEGTDRSATPTHRPNHPTPGGAGRGPGGGGARGELDLGVPLPAGPFLGGCAGPWLEAFRWWWGFRTNPSVADPE